jgi:uncharacterized integral membrane protein
LANIAEQMAVKNRRSKRIWKTIGIVIAIIIAVTIEKNVKKGFGRDRFKFCVNSKN